MPLPLPANLHVHILCPPAESDQLLQGRCVLRNAVRSAAAVRGKLRLDDCSSRLGSILVCWGPGPTIQSGAAALADAVTELCSRC